MIHTHTLRDLSFPTTKIEQPKPDRFILSEINSTSPTISVINKQLEENSSDNPLSSIDKEERYEKHSIKDESSSFKCK
jgi:hypothetical protein